jgi:signal peptidase II
MRVGNIFGIFGIAVILDQTTKALIRVMIDIGDTKAVIGQVVRITYVENPGIAFGIRVGNGFVFTLLSILASIGVVVYLITHWDEGNGVKSGLALILGGACGNLIDRILYRQVVDFIDVGINEFRWPVFNVADSAVVVGMIIFFISLYLTERKKTKILPEIEGEMG